MIHLPLFILLALIAEIIGTVGGFGSSLLFIPIASYFLDFHSVLGVTALFHIFSNVSKIAFFKHGFDKKLIFSIGIPAVIFVLIGAWLSKFINTHFLDLILGAFLIILSSIFLIKNHLKLKPNKTNEIIGGVLSGFFAGILGTGGAIRGLVLGAYHLKIEVFIATSAIIDLTIDTSRGIVYFFNGFVHQDDLYLLPILLLVSVLGTWLGKKILSKISENVFQKSVLILILATGMSNIIKYFL